MHLVDLLLADVQLNLGTFLIYPNCPQLFEVRNPIFALLFPGMSAKLQYIEIHYIFKQQRQ